MRGLSTKTAAGSVYPDMRIKTAFAALLPLAAALLQLPATAQAETQAQLRVRVVDQTNAVLPRATVTIFTLDGNPGVTATADDKGVVVFPAVSAGLTEIVVKFPGFSPYIGKATLEPGDNAQTAALRLAPVIEEVTVRATPSGHRS